ncbi:MAG: helix-turn-helix transcriptional regulator [Clostridia bacterium]|nr:helix-turn-helix transcriptional regulator [Clostridia bacterium]
MQEEKDLRRLIGENIVRLRLAAPLTQAEFAERLNYTDKAVSKWERGDSVPDITVLKQIADLFGVTVDYLLSEHLPEEKPQSPERVRLRNRNHLIITVMSVLIVWFLALFAYFVGDSVFRTHLWQAFLIAVPVSCIVVLVLNSVWGNRSRNFIIISVLIWSTLATVYLLAIRYNLWTIFLLGIPGQASVILWSRLRFTDKPAKKNRKKEKSPGRL